jgi:hypothetical protein
MGAPDLSTAFAVAAASPRNDAARYDPRAQIIGMRSSARAEAVSPSLGHLAPQRNPKIWPGFLLPG